MTDAHRQIQHHTYWVVYPEHEPREDDPHYKDFNAYHRRTRATARCFVGERIGFHTCGDLHGSPCLPVEGGQQPSLELHHTHIEFALQNGVDLKALEHDYPGVSDPDTLGAWVESAANLRWLCQWHHRGPIGAHKAAHADWEGSVYINNLLSAE